MSRWRKADVRLDIVGSDLGVFPVVPAAAGRWRAMLTAGLVPGPTSHKARFGPLVGMAGAGAVLMAAASWWVGAVPLTLLHGQRPAPLSWLAMGGAAPRAIFYLGLAAAIAAWLLLGRRVLRGASTPREVCLFIAASAVPLLLAAPMGRDLWAYAGQGNVLQHGLNPYAHGPGDVPGGYADEVSRRWLYSGTPYGPLWVQISRLAVAVCGNHVTAAALLLRLPALAGLALWVWAVPRLAPGRPHAQLLALWLGAASPLTVVLGVGGGHNDLLMIGLVLAGLVLARRGGSHRRLAAAGAVIAVGVAVKSPAVIALAFTVPLWAHATRRGRARQIAAACVVAAGSAVVCFAVLTMVSGVGLGWVHQTGADISTVSWLSLPTAAAMLLKLAAGHTHGVITLDARMRAMRTAGEILAAAVITGLWFRSLRRAPLALLAVALGVLSVLVPSGQPWYFCWGLAIAGLVITRRSAVIALASVGVTFPIMIRPDGRGLEMQWPAIPIILGSALICWLALRRYPASAHLPAARYPAEDAGP